MLFERQWAFTVLDRVQTRLEEEAARSGKRMQFDRLKAFLTESDRDIRYSQLAIELGMSEGAIKTAIHRLRRRFRESLQEEIAQTVADSEDIGGEIRYLMAAIRS